MGEDENVGDVHDRLMAMSGPLAVRTIDLIEQCDREGRPVPTTPQPEVCGRPAPKIFKETCQIDCSKTAREVVNFVRGLSPYPAAWCNLTIGDNTYENVKIYRSVLGKGPITLDCADGTVSIEELQLPGKKRMDAKSLLNGLRIN